jgi:hypothetical protein
MHDLDFDIIAARAPLLERVALRALGSRLGSLGLLARFHLAHIRRDARHEVAELLLLGLLLGRRLAARLCVRLRVLEEA